jgi:hypothetical protein
MIISKIEFLNNLLSGCDLKKSVVLDAGTGKTSSRLLIDKHPNKLFCVAYPGDKRKGEPVQQILKSANNMNYTFLYGDLKDIQLFPEETFSFILADYLLGEVSVDKVLAIFYNMHHWLQPNGKILLLDREYLQTFQPQIQYLSMGEVEGKVDFLQFTDSDFIDALDMLLRIPTQIDLFRKQERTFDFPSLWIKSWLEQTGFYNIHLTIFQSRIDTKEEFESKLIWVKERISRMKNSNLQKGLLEEVSKLERAFYSSLSESSYFLRTHYCFQSTK